MRQIKAVIFDLDGTLLDTEALSCRAVLLAFGKSLPAHVMEECSKDGYRLPWELKKQILGLRGSEWIPIVLLYAQKKWGVRVASSEHHGDTMNPIEKNNCDTDNGLPSAPSVDEFWKAWEENLNNFCGEIEACPGATELVQALANTAGLPLAIATSSRKESVSKKKTRHGTMFQCISSIVAGDDDAVKCGKPAPDIYIEAAKRLNVSPQDCLVFEDALSGIRSGKAAGCFVVAVPDPRYTKEEVKNIFEQEADLVLETLWQFDGKQFGIDDVNMVTSS